MWDNKDQPYHSGEPMLEDDGRYIDCACVPYSISQAGGVPMDRVLDVCRLMGWREGGGMATDLGIAAAEQLGLEFVPWCEQFVVAGTRTLRKVLDRLSSSRNYIVATKDHWLAVVAGENRDRAETHLRSLVIDCWEVRKSPS